MSRGKKRVPRSRHDLEGQLAEQIGFLRTSARLFDAGEKAEAKRLAGTLRVLLYDEGRSQSLLGQLGMLGLGFVNTNLPFNPANLAGHNGLLVMRMEHRDGVLTGGFEPRVLAPVSVEPGTMPFVPWWEEDVVLVDASRTRITRRDIVRFVAHQDGGAHVDPALDAVYHALSRGASLGWTFHSPEGERPVGDPTPPCLRQIAHEVLQTLENPRQMSPFARQSSWYARHLGESPRRAG